MHNELNANLLQVNPHSNNRYHILRDTSLGMSLSTYGENIATS